MSGLILSSQIFDDGDYLANDHVLSEAYGFGCAGGNLSPQFSWSGVPEGTKSFALTCFDPDAPTGSGFWHWAVVNIPAATTALELGAGDPSSGKMPAGALEVRTDFGAPWLWRTLPTGGRPSPPLPLFAARGRARGAYRSSHPRRRSPDSCCTTTRWQRRA